MGQKILDKNATPVLEKRKSSEAKSQLNYLPQGRPSGSPARHRVQASPAQNGGREQIKVESDDTDSDQHVKDVQDLPDDPLNFNKDRQAQQRPIDEMMDEIRRKQKEER